MQVIFSMVSSQGWFINIKTIVVKKFINIIRNNEDFIFDYEDNRIYEKGVISKNRDISEHTSHYYNIFIKSLKEKDVYYMRDIRNNYGIFGDNIKLVFDEKEYAQFNLIFGPFIDFGYNKS